MLLAFPLAAHAAFPGQNGKILFGDLELETINPDGSGRAELFTDTSGFSEVAGAAWSPSGQQVALNRTRCSSPRFCGIPVGLFLVNADGSGLHQVPNAQADATTPAWSPNGRWIVYASRNGNMQIVNDDLYAIHPDGTGQVRLTEDEGGNIDPAWSPDGSKIAFASGRHGGLNYEIYVMNADGSNQVRLTETASLERGPNWSPDGSKIAFWEKPSGTDANRIWVMNPDGSGKTLLTDPTQSINTEPAWSPDGSKIAFMGWTGDVQTLYTMNPDGSGVTPLTDEPGRYWSPDWQPLPHPGYPRPKTASPVRVSLVPAYVQCVAPDRQHGPPLAFESCYSTGGQQSSTLTVGTDMSGFVSYRSVIGNPNTLADEADIAVRVHVSDVLEFVSRQDYRGDVEARSIVRLTDRASGGPASTIDLVFPLPTHCAATAATDVGSTCSLSSTLEAFVPGAIAEGQRTVLELSQVQVFDGDTEGHTPFLRQGVFVP